MNKFTSLLVAAALLAPSTMLSVPADASTFVAWQVRGVPWGDTLNARKYPSNVSQKQSAYPNGTVLQMTGRCTGGIDLADISTAPAKWQRKQVRTRWCEVWHSPAKNGAYTTGWVYGKFIAPY
ncbi:SH3 domain-containing protein [Mesorhizobium sp. NBSH29]|uniref:SH3 domain-containing protein n=1 Tax=Mesorhizobium sp. NBSH29 TaxID=2654249 RepID=UPI0018967953|nr:SH3 domain-containing protein [Mesorhizobium sp. NBSH29]QPC87175.1 SH3 domain-containing protein [Mesorhizobium sp. NBSH29]